MERYVKKHEIKKLDILWSKKVRSVEICQLCGKKGVLHAHHIYSRRHYNTRWDIDNGICLCYRCHLFFVHKDTYEAAKAIEKVKGKELLEKLSKKKNIIRDYYDYEQILKELQNQEVQDVDVTI